MKMTSMKKAAAVMIWFQSGGQEPKILLTKRSENSKTFPGWYAAVGGSVETGECAIEAICREVYEETGMFRPKHEYRLIECYQEEEFKCFIFELNLSTDFLAQIKDMEPDKHSPWTLYSIEEALKLPKLMPAIEEILLTKQEELATLKTS